MGDELREEFENLRGISEDKKIGKETLQEFLVIFNLK